MIQFEEFYNKSRKNVHGLCVLTQDTGNSAAQSSGKGGIRKQQLEDLFSGLDSVIRDLRTNDADSSSQRPKYYVNAGLPKNYSGNFDVKNTMLVFQVFYNGFCNNEADPDTKGKLITVFRYIFAMNVFACTMNVINSGFTLDLTDFNSNFGISQECKTGKNGSGYKILKTQTQSSLDEKQLRFREEYWRHMCNQWKQFVQYYMKAMSVQQQYILPSMILFIEYKIYNFMRKHNVKIENVRAHFEKVGKIEVDCSKTVDMHRFSENTSGIRFSDVRKNGIVSIGDVFSFIGNMDLSKWDVRKKLQKMLSYCKLFDGYELDNDLIRRVEQEMPELTGKVKYRRIGKHDMLKAMFLMMAWRCGYHIQAEGLGNVQDDGEGSEECPIPGKMTYQQEAEGIVEKMFENSSKGDSLYGDRKQISTIIMEFFNPFQAIVRKDETKSLQFVESDNFSSLNSSDKVYTSVMSSLGEIRKTFVDEFMKLMSEKQEKNKIQGE